MTSFPFLFFFFLPFFYRTSVAFSAPESQNDAWVSIVLFEYRDIESLGIEVNDGSGYPMVSYLTIT